MATERAVIEKNIEVVVGGTLRPMTSGGNTLEMPCQLLSPVSSKTPVPSLRSTPSAVRSPLKIRLLQPNLAPQLAALCAPLVNASAEIGRIPALRTDLRCRSAFKREQRLAMLALSRLKPLLRGALHADQ